MKIRKPNPTEWRLSTSLMCKLGSIAVHVDEALSQQGHPFDWSACRALLEDPEVVAWLKQMDSLAMIPKKR